MNGNHGFIMLQRTNNTIELLSGDPKAFRLLTLIAIRARWNPEAINWKGLGLGEAMIGDCESCGLTRTEYRSAVKRLQRYGLITAKVTKLGTIAKIINETIYSITTNHPGDVGMCVTCDTPKYTLRQVRGAFVAGKKEVLSRLTEQEEA